MALVTYQTENRVGYITLNRPDQGNSLNPEISKELKEALAEAEADDACTIVVLRAQGEAFCAGIDLEHIRSMVDFTYNQHLEDSIRIKNLYQQIYGLRKLVIGQIQGDAISSGCGLAMVCDLSFAVPGAMLGFNQIKSGFLPAIAIKFLVRKIGEGRARELLLTGDLIPAKKAAEYGLITDVVPVAKLSGFVQELAERLSRENSAHSMALAKQLFVKSQDKKLSRALKYAAEMNSTARNSSDCRKGMTHLLNHQQLEW